MWTLPLTTFLTSGNLIFLWLSFLICKMRTRILPTLYIVVRNRENNIHVKCSAHGLAQRVQVSGGINSEKFEITS